MHEFVLDVEESPVAEVAKAPVEMCVCVDIYEGGEAGIAGWIVIHYVSGIRFNYEEDKDGLEAHSCVLLLLALHL